MPFLAIPAVAASLIGGGGAVAGGLLARSGSQSIADTQQSIANKQFALTQPAFQKSYDYYSQLMNGSPTALQQAVGPDINNTNMFFNQAKNNVMQNAQARGGGLTAGLTNMEGMRAMSLSQLVGGARQGAPAALSNLATGNSQLGLAALAGAQQSNTQNSILQGQAMSGIGTFLTRMLSGMPSSSGNSAGSNNYFPGTPSALVGNNPGSTPGQTMNYYPPNGQGNPFYGQ